MKTITVQVVIEDEDIKFKDSYSAEYNMELFLEEPNLFFLDMEAAKQELEDKYFIALVKKRQHLKSVVSVFGNERTTPFKG